MKTIQKNTIVVGAAIVIAGIVSIVFWNIKDYVHARLFPVLEYQSLGYLPPEEENDAEVYVPPPPQHITTPSAVRAIYMTSWIAATPSLREKLVDFIDTSEINAVVIDVKDYTGRIAFDTDDSFIDALGSEEVRVPDMREFIQHLHEKDIYVIARISVFQDPYYAFQRADLAVQRSDGAVWKDRKGLSWMDPSSKEVWDYTVKIGKAAERVGFDELNFDYVRFPSDGNMKDISYPVWQESKSKSDVIEEFFAYLDAELADVNVPISVDLFGFVTTNTDDLNIGQVLEKAAPHVDFIAPMVYPSHYPDGYNGYANPAEYPYEVVYKAMLEGSRRLIAASSTPAKLRPWLQDFDLGATYTADMVRKQIQATYDAGLNSWMIWDPKNIYTKEAYLPEVINN